MDKLSGFRHGLEEAWHSVADGWRQLRERAAGALTRFKPSNKPAESPPAAGALQPAAGALQLPSAGWALLAGDVYEGDTEIVVRLEVPGMDKHDFELEVRDDVLVVRGEKRYEREATAGRYHVRQCAYGSFHRSIPLPAPVVGEKAAATYRNGVLRIALPKAEHVRARRIEVKTG